MATSELGRQPVSRRRVLIGASTAATGLFAAALIGCDAKNGKSAPTATRIAATAPRSGGTLRVPAFADVESLDLYVSAGGAISAVTSLVYSRLFRFAPGDGKPASGQIEGDLVSAFEQPDPLTYIVHLKKNAKFDQRAPTNGRAVTSQDVVRSWARFESKHIFRANLAASKSPDASISSITAIDDSTVKIALAFPDGLLLPSLAHNQYFLVNPIEGIDGKFDLGADMRGSGPFTLDRYQRSVGFKFKRNPDWFDGPTRPYVDDIDMPIIPDNAQQEVQFRAGNFHATSVRAENIPIFARELTATRIVSASPGSSGPIAGYSWLPNQPWHDERVRRALSMSIDREAYIDVIYNPAELKALGVSVNRYWNTPLSPGFGAFWLDPKSKDFGPGAAYYQHNPGEATKLLAAAGFRPDSPLQFDIVITAGNRFPAAATINAETVQAMLNKTGAIKATVAPVDYTTKFIPIYFRGGSYFEGPTQKAAIQFGPGGGPPDPLLWLSAYFLPTGERTVTGNKDTQWADLYKLVRGQRGVTDYEKRVSGVHDIQRFVGERQLALSLGQSIDTMDLVPKRLRGPEQYRAWPGGFGIDGEMYSRYWFDE